MTVLSSRFTRAVDHARIAHAAQVRKGSGTPYLYHLLSVAGLVLDYGGDEDQAIAGLLHDVLEDCGSGHEALIRAEFGERVAAIVRDCTDGSAETKAEARTPEARRQDWLERKLAYLDHLAAEPLESLLVGACDKLHNARAILADLHGDAGLAVFDRFTAGRLGTLQYYQALAEVVLRRAGEGGARFHELARELDRTVGEMHALAGAQQRMALAAGSMSGEG